MSGSVRGKRTSPVDWFFPLLGIVIAVALAWGIGFLQGGENTKRNAAPHQHAQAAEGRMLASCAGRKGAGLAECVREKVEASEETARAEQDLTAQQQAAWGSIFGALWGGVGLCITVVGTVLLYQQIVLTRQAVQDTGDATDAMREANKIALDTAKMQLRAYVLCDDTVTNRTLDPSGRVVKYDIEIHWKNSGDTPATDIRCQVGYIISNIGLPKDATYNIVDAYGSERKSIGPGGTAVIIVSIPVVEMRLPYGFETFFYSWIEYDDNFKEFRRRSEVCHKFRLSDIMPTKDTDFFFETTGPFNGVDDGCHMPLQTKGQSKN